MEQPDFFVHESSYVDEGAQIGEGTKIWHFCHVQKGAVIGKNCSLGQNVNIGPDVRIGDGVRLQNNVSVYEGVELEDHVFCGPSCVFTNVLIPRTQYPVHGKYVRTRVGKGASLGANCTVVCGHNIGKQAMVAAGAVVTRDVKDYALVAGVPARQIGWVCECGKRLYGNHDKGLSCETGGKLCSGERLEVDYQCECGRAYHEKNGVLTQKK